MKLHLISGLALLCLSACSQQAAVTPPETPAKTDAPAPAIPTNATAMDRYTPLKKVTGDPKPLPETATSEIDDPETVFSDAITYSEETKSYALLVWHKGALVLEKYFEPYTSDIRAEPASMHKSVLGLVVTKALSEGKIESVDAPVSTWLPEWKDDPRGDITLRQLLTMSAGLAPLSYEGGAAAPALRFANGEDDTETVLLNLPFEESAGPHFHYQNTVSQLLMLVTERALGEPYTDYLSREIWKPVGASDAYSYAFSEDGMSRGYASLLARPLDWLRLGLLIKNGGSYAGEEIIPSAYLEQMIAPSALNPNYGWQIWRGAEFQEVRYYTAEKSGFGALASEPYLTDDIIFFDGFGGQRVYISRKEDLVIVHLGDTDMKWDDARLPNSVIRALNAD